MQVAVLASGSKGNCIFIELDGVRLLIDAGISARRIKQELRGIGVAIEDLDGVFITHEHSDHINGLATLTKKYRLPVYTRANTFKSMSCYHDIPLECIHPIADSLSLGRVQVRAFSIPHDAADPVGYSVIGSRRVTLATDLGFVNDTIQRQLNGSNVLILEANHDIQLLRNGRYPWHLKQRILSNRGHLCNNSAAWTLANLKNPPQHVFLAHLSQENNTPELAMETVSGILQKQRLGDRITLHMTDQTSCTSIEL